MIQKTIHNLFGGVFLVSLLISGCSHPDYLAEKNVEGGCWAANDTLFFEVQTSGDSLGVSVEVTFDATYKYSNLYVRLVDINHNPGGIRITQTFIDPQGNWSIEPSGGKYKVLFQGFRKKSFGKPGTYRLGLIHDMREESLCGVKAVRIF